jgi:serine/threonine protein phosphatase PrpC
MKPALSLAPRVAEAPPLAPPRGRWQVGARSETGYVREQNEDRMARARIGACDLYLVVDGMGGQAAGALAAELTVQALGDSMAAQAGARDLEAALRRAFSHANEVVHARAQEPGAHTAGMGATAVALVIDGERALVGHVGDSRAYLWRDGRLKRLTRDHSRVQRMIDAGMITPEQALDHPDASVVERAVGHLEALEVELAPWLRLRRGDQLLLCTDGLCGYATDAEIAAVLAFDEAPQALVDRLVGMSLAKGGQDNVTVQIVRFGREARTAASGDGFLARAAGPLALLAACGVAAAGVLGLRALQAQQDRVAQLEGRIQDLAQDVSAVRDALASVPPVAPTGTAVEAGPVVAGRGAAPASAAAPTSAGVPSTATAPAPPANRPGTTARVAGPTTPAPPTTTHAAHDRPVNGRRTSPRTSSAGTPASTPASGVRPPPDEVPVGVSDPATVPTPAEVDPPRVPVPASAPAAASPPPPPAAAPSGPGPNAQAESARIPRRNRA